MNENLNMNCPCGSAKPFAQCHGASTPTALVATPPVPPPIMRPGVTRKLDLAAGQNVREGFEGVDLWKDSQHVVNLMQYPWPFEDSSVLELHCSHYIEHIPMGFVDELGNYLPDGRGEGKEALFKFFDECFRILIPGGKIRVIAPICRSDRAYQDPTHRRFIAHATFLYLNKRWRTENKLDHYGVDCNFDIHVGHAITQEGTLLHPEAAARRMNEWNFLLDVIADLTSCKDGFVATLPVVTS